MRKKAILGIAIVVLMFTGAAIFMYSRKKDKSKDSKTDDTQSEESEESKEEQQIKPARDYSSTSAIKTLKDDIKKSYHVMEIMCPMSNGAMQHCQNKTTYSQGLVNGVWIQMKRSIKQYKDKMNQSTSDSNERAYGDNLLASLDADIDKKFDPKFFNTSKQFYKDYIARGGQAI